MRAVVSKEGRAHLIDLQALDFGQVVRIPDLDLTVRSLAESYTRRGDQEPSAFQL
jgi:hypothetical protein